MNTTNTINVLGISPGTRIMGFALHNGRELIDWRVKKNQDAWGEQKLEKWLSFIRRYIEKWKVHKIVIKVNYAFRNSDNLSRLIEGIRLLAEKLKIAVQEFFLEELQMYFLRNDRRNKAMLCQVIAEHHAQLYHRFKKELQNLNKYHVPLFEAVGLAQICSDN